ncbi:MAG TPA: prolipoprotein diacylglyceryl transferase family protein [Gemmatimonadaceae bacterium]|nr:prolipoprotein diacylglyceryl transferase family protein [Gemmatimonadaceae bacterium]
MPLASEATVHHALNIAVGPLTITGFGIAVAAAFVLGQMVASKEMERRGLDSNPVPDIVAATLVGFIIGAKIYYAVLTHSLDSLFTRGGFVFWGGFAGSVAAGALMIRIKKLRFWQIADVFCIGLAGGYSVGRTGCWAVGDDYGKPWPGGWLSVKFPEGVPPSTAGNMSSTFGVHFPQGTNPLDVIAVYPTQLLEVLLGFVVFLLVWRLREHKHAEGWLFGVWAVYAGVERFLVEFLRAKDDRISGLLGGLSAAQVISIGIFVFGLIWMRMRRDVTAAHPGIHAR